MPPNLRVQNRPVLVEHSHRPSYSGRVSSMSQRSTEAPERPIQRDSSSDVPTPDIAEFIRYCHHRRRAGWPELYDEMCAVASRREFHGWGHDQLAARGVTFCLPDMPQLAGWVRAVIAGPAPVEPTLSGNGIPATLQAAQA
jgi:hypothetical protein